MSATAGAVALFVAALLPLRFPQWAMVGRVLGALGALALVLSAGYSGSWPFVLLAAGAAALGTPFPLILAAAGAVILTLRPDASAPVAAAAAALAVAVMADSLYAWVRARRASGADALGPVLVSGVLLTLVLAWVDRGAVLSWSFGVGAGSGRVLLPGVGVAMGAGLVAALGGMLLVGATKVAPEAAGVRPAGVAALWVAVAATTLGLILALAALSPLGEEVGAAAARPLATLLAVAGTLAVCLLEATGVAAPDAAAQERRARLGTRAAVALALLATTAAGLEAWWRVGTYATALTAAAAAATLLGLAAREPEVRFMGGRCLIFLAALLYLLPA